MSKHDDPQKLYQNLGHLIYSDFPVLSVACEFSNPGTFSHKRGSDKESDLFW